MSIFLSWVVFPVVVLVLATGCGLLAEKASGRTLPGALLIPLGIAVIIVAAGAATASGTTARLATPLVVVLAVLGIGLAFPWRRGRFDFWAASAGGGVFAAYAAPIVLTGTATFAGYITLDDTATWLALTDRAMTHGRSLAGLAPSTYQQVLTDYLTHGNPLGSEMVIGTGSQLTRQDPAWIFQPALAVFAVALGLTIYVLAGGLIKRRWLRAVIAVLAAQPALLFAYVFWAGMKEIAAASMIALLAATVASTIADWRNLRGVVPAALAAAALLGILSPAGLVWFVVPSALCVLALARSGLRSLLAAGWRVLVAAAVLSIPSLLIGLAFFRFASNDPLTSGSVANLGHPLSVLQMIGVWPATDFRLRPHHAPLAYLLMGLVCASAIFCALFAAKRGANALVFYGLCGVGGILIVLALDHVGFGSPWLDAKAMAEGSPAILALGLAGGAVLFETGRRTEGAVVCGAIAAGVLWSNALAYSNVWLAPRAQLAELQTIGTRFAGDGPTLMTEYQPYGVRHFLRNLDPEGASERRRRLIPLLNGQSLAPGKSADLDQFQPGGILVYRTLVLRRSPVESRPPSVYSLVSRGHWYDVWQRPVPATRTVKEHLGLGSPLDPAAVPRCATVRAAATRATAAGGELATVLRPQAPIVFDLNHASYPSSWVADSSSGTLVPQGGGKVSLSVTVPTRGRYGLWLGGSFRRTMTARVDGRRVGSVTGQLNADGQWTELGTVPLRPGTHQVVLDYGGSRLAPGAGGVPFGFGPLVLSTATEDAPVRYVKPQNALSLCGRRLDWLEVVSG
jgi:hypothetical protein